MENAMNQKVQKQDPFICFLIWDSEDTFIGVQIVPRRLAVLLTVGLE
jgi:hypothetical protein